MKGDFTRSTFQPNKHYTSVRMQQGRLQLDSDWNEQVDIEAYLRHAQAVDMIGANSGVPTSEGDSDQPYRDSFKISVTPDGSDLAIAPGRLYVNGTFCELEATPFIGTFTATNRIKVTTLIVDGRPLGENQWIEIEPDNNPDLKTSVKIAEVNTQTLELTLNLDSEKIKSNLLKVKDYTKKVENKSQGLRLCRVVTYNTQTDYINPEEALKQDTTIYLAYVDVWQRHITAIEDPIIREVALNGSDTTTRTKTVCQIKLKNFDELINEVEGKAKKKLQTAFENNRKLNDLNAPDWESLIQQVWGKFITQQEQRQALMNACANLCSSSGSQSNGSGYQRLENLLYRVEIYEPSQTEQGENQGNNGTNKATFKWSRDNGSIVSPIEKIEGNIITIRKSSQDAWISSRAGQWLEITNEEIELKGQPGVMVPLSRAFDTKIEFNESRIVNGPIPNNSTKVRLWSHEVKNAPNGVIPIADDWIELETGIKVRFYKDSVYRTGDYWLIPARNATNDIEWPHNQAELQKRQPLPQPPKGIHHDYCSLALIQFDGQVNGEEETAEQEEQQSKTIRDLRIIFPPLMRCLDKAGGIITGTLEIQSDLYVTGRYQKQVDRYVDGKVGIGTKEPLARFHTQAAKPIPGQEKITSNKQQVNLHEGSNFTTEFHEGDLLKVDGQERIITKVEDKSLTINETLAITEPKSFEYQQPIARLENSEGNPQFVVLANGNTGIGTPTPYNSFDVVGGVAIGQAYAGKTKTPDNGLLVDGTVGIGIDPDTDAKLHVKGSLKLTTNQQSATIGCTDDNWLKFSANNLIGYSFDQSLKGQQGVVTNRLENYNDESLILRTNNQDRIAIAPDTGDVSITSRVGLGVSNPVQKLVIEHGNVGIGYNDAEQSAMLAVKENVGIGITKPNAQLHVIGTVQIDTKANTNTLIRLNQNNQSVSINLQDNRLRFNATNLTGYSFDQPITAQQGVVTNRIENHNNERLVLQTNDQDRITIAPNTGNVGIGLAPDTNAKLNLGGALKLTNNQQSATVSLTSDNSLQFSATNLTGYFFDRPITVQQGVVTNRLKNHNNESLILRTNEQDRITIAPNTGNVGIGLAPDTNAKLNLGGALKLTNNQQSATVSFTNDNSLQFSATNLTGYSFDQPITAQQGVVTNRIENHNNERLVLQTNNQDRITIAPNTGNVGIGLAPDTNAKLNLAGALKLTNNQQSVTFSLTSNNSLQFAATNLTGYSFDQPITAQQGVVTNRIENSNGQNFVLQTNNQERITITQNGKVSIGTHSSPSQLDINGTAKATQLEGNSLKLKNLTVEQFSNDGNLTGNEQSLPTEKAVKTYVDEEIDKVQKTLDNKAARTELETELDELRTELQISFNGEITEVKATVADKAELNGNFQENFKAKSLQVDTSIYAKSVATETIDSKTVTSAKTLSNGFYQISSRALKEEISDLSSQEVAAIFRALNPVKFIYTEDEQRTPHAGFIAEDTPDLLTANDKQVIKVVDIVAVLTKVVQDHRKTLTDLVKVVRKQQSEIATLTQKVKELEEKKEP